MATIFFYIHVMATSFFYIHVMATSFFYTYIYIFIDIYKLTERPVVLLNANFSTGPYIGHLAAIPRFLVSDKEFNDRLLIQIYFLY